MRHTHTYTLIGCVIQECEHTQRVRNQAKRVITYLGSSKMPKYGTRTILTYLYTAASGILHTVGWVLIETYLEPSRVRGYEDVESPAIG